ncbi:MAG: hypothetical protein ACLR8P_04820 [Clostridium fessum]
MSRCGHKNTAAEYESRPTVKVENPVRQDISLYTDLTGLVEPQSRASVMPKMSGEVLEVYFRRAIRSRRGQALCKIDSDALTALKLQVDAASVALKNADSNLSRYQAASLQMVLSPGRRWSRHKTAHRARRFPMNLRRINTICR